jgi:CheY-like chemotaxis protein
VAERFDPAAHTNLTLGAELAAGEYVCVAVHDDGEGMSRETLKRLFDPFFTTKSSGRGLGLAAVLGIVRAHQGALEVVSKEGAGTTFRVWIPVAKRPVREAQVRAVASEAPGQQLGKRVLVVDDERVVREAASAVLEAYGFDVETADSGDHAISAMERTHDIDAVVLDMTMPGRNISATYAGIREMRAGIPIVLTSGFTEQEIIDDLLSHEGTAFMQKPFSAKDLVDKLCALMAR